MRRWNGWGDDTHDYPLPNGAAQFITEQVGPGTPLAGATLEEALEHVPAGRLKAHPLITDDPAKRLRHARGHSLDDLIALNSGQIGAFPDGVAYPTSAQQVRELLAYAQSTGAKLIPYGGGTSVVGHINPLAGEVPVLTVDLGRLSSMQDFSAHDQLATFGAGVRGPELEATLRARGYTLGHFPQSFEYSSLGGWVATRSSGQQSIHYGRIEQLFRGGRVETPAGALVLPPYPASAAGPDLRELVLGSEGRLGFITEVTVQISPLPQREEFRAVLFPTFEQGLNAVREISQARIALSMLRYSTAVETETLLKLAGHELLVGMLEGLLKLRGVGREKCLLIFGATGSAAAVRGALKETLKITGDYGGVHTGSPLASRWQKGRFRTPYLRNTLWQMGYAVDTLETAAAWSRVPGLIEGIEGALRGGLEQIGERVYAFTHLSHQYPTGSNIYTTYLYRMGDTWEETRRRWQVLKTAASEALVAGGGTISHQHGVGLDHRPWLAGEKGPAGMAAIGALLHTLDPEGLMNPGKMVE